MLRFADDVVYESTSLVVELGVPDAVELEGALDFHATVLLHDDAVELVLGPEGTALNYPFRAGDLQELADGLTEDDG